MRLNSRPPYFMLVMICNLLLWSSLYLSLPFVIWRLISGEASYQPPLIQLIYTLLALVWMIGIFGVWKGWKAYRALLLLGLGCTAAAFAYLDTFLSVKAWLIPLLSFGDPINYKTWAWVFFQGFVFVAWFFFNAWYLYSRWTSHFFGRET
jgi:hypothetical protein